MIDTLAQIYDEVAVESERRGTGQVRRKLPDRIAETQLACVAESLGPRTQLLSGLPWMLPNGTLSDKGRLLDRDLLNPLGHTASPSKRVYRYAYLTDVSHLWLGRNSAGKLRRPSTSDKEHCAEWLERELDAVGPEVVLLLGRHAAAFFLRRFGGVRASGLGELMAEPFECRVGGRTVAAVPTLHPTGAQMAAGGSGRAYASTVEAVRGLLRPS